MAQSPHCGPAAVDWLSPRAHVDSRPIFGAVSHNHNPAHGLLLASQLAQHIHPPSRLPVLWYSNWRTALRCTWRMNVGREEETTKKKYLCAYGLLLGPSRLGHGSKGSQTKVASAIHHAA